MDDAGPQSLFVVVCYERNPLQYGILRFELLDDTPEQIKWTKEVVRINQRPQIQWLLSPPTSCDDNLYMVPHLRFKPGKTKPFYGYKFNFRTGEFGPFNPPPMPSKSFGHVVNLRGQIYFMAHEWHYEKQSVFQCYNPMEKSWRTLAPFPNSSSCLGPIVGTAVWGDDTILFNVGSRCIWAYVVSEDKWYAVGIDDSWCVSIEGEAVFIKDTIYALSNCSFGSVLALSIVKGGIEGGLVFKCSLISVFRVLNLVPILYGEEAWMRTRHLVHLGEDNFCVVQSCGLLGYNDIQPIQLTYIKLMGESSKTMRHDVKIESSKTVRHDVKIENSKTVRHDVKIKNSVTFIVQLCFTLPQDRTTGLEQGKRLVFNFNPFAKDDDASKPVQEQGHLIFVRKLPPNTTVGQVEQGFKVFGRIKKDGIQIEKTRQGMYFASVKFESAFSKDLAVQASTILIGDREVEISEKSLTGKKLNRGHARVGGNDSHGEDEARSFNVTEIASMMNRGRRRDEDDEIESSSLHHPIRVDLKGYRVKQETAPLFAMILTRHGDIGKNCKIKCPDARGCLVDLLCSVYQSLEDTNLMDVTDVELEGMVANVNHLLQIQKFDVGWLSERLEDIRVTKTMIKEKAEKEEAVLKKTKEMDEYWKRWCASEAELGILKADLAKVNQKNDNLKEKLGAAYLNKSLVHGLV